MTIHETLDINEKPTMEELAEISEAAGRPIVYDEECAPLSDEVLWQAVTDRNRRLMANRAQ